MAFKLFFFKGFADILKEKSGVSFPTTDPRTALTKPAYVRLVLSESQVKLPPSSSLIIIKKYRFISPSFFIFINEPGSMS